ncbi:uncharacterized protein IUM83_03570 [Phytophthora cinnamomi]|uniref:uncharacterized protein n=1 Tax=Phytophthora cinnamomi TaxID=4785 RepID=UPI00355AB525|nr:hypothetical protein IUM83_03570 [Phytophthora cinnamomi]
MTKKRGDYTKSKLNSAVERVVAGEKAKAVSVSTKIPYRTLIKWVGKCKKGESMESQRRGPQPRLTAEAEQNLCEWIMGRQLIGKPAKRGEIIAKASTIAEMTTGTGVGSGWYRRFMKRHPALSVRTSQSISKARNAVDTTDIWQLFGTLAKLYIEGHYSPERVFKVDETAFQTSTKTKKVVAARGSSNVWHTDAGISFHLSVVACGSAAGAVVPPLFEIPGEDSLSRNNG